MIFLSTSPLTAKAQFVQNYDQLHEAYAAGSYIHPGDPAVSLYIQKFFPMDGSPIFYSFAAYNSGWQNLFTVDSSVSFIVDDQTFFPKAKYFSRNITNFPIVHTASRVEFILSDALIDSLKIAQNISIVSADKKINYQLTPGEIKELKNVIAQNHY